MGKRGLHLSQDGPRDYSPKNQEEPKRHKESPHDRLWLDTTSGRDGSGKTPIGQTRPEVTESMRFPYVFFTHRSSTTDP